MVPTSSVQLQLLDCRGISDAIGEKWNLLQILPALPYWSAYNAEVLGVSQRAIYFQYRQRRFLCNLSDLLKCVSVKQTIIYPSFHMHFGSNCDIIRHTAFGFWACSFSVAWAFQSCILQNQSLLFPFAIRYFCVSVKDTAFSWSALFRC